MFFPLKEWKRRRSRDEGKKESEEEKQGEEAAVVEEMCGCLWEWKNTDQWNDDNDNTTKKQKFDTQTQIN